MLEILLVVMLGRRLGQKAESRGLSKSHGWLILPFWVVPEFAGALIMGMITDELLAIYAGALAGAALGAVFAFQVVGRMGVDAPLATPSVYGQVTPEYPAQQQAAEALRPQAGFCSECGENVWLTPTGSCTRGHAPECISGRYAPNR